MFANLTLPWNRIVVLGFVLMVLFFTGLVLNKTRLGLNVRAVTQNRSMAACCGVPTRTCRYAGVWSGLRHCWFRRRGASQLGNVGPELGQGYIIDSLPWRWFLAALDGGRSVAAAFWPWDSTKILEPQMGAVLGKIVILVAIILFIQKRPQGIVCAEREVTD